MCQTAWRREELLNVARHSLAGVVHSHVLVSLEMAIWLNTAGQSSAKLWMPRQIPCDLMLVLRVDDKTKVQKWKSCIKTQ